MYKVQNLLCKWYKTAGTFIVQRFHRTQISCYAYT